MRRELLFIIGLSSAIYATQDISCVDFVSMSKNEAQSYLDEYRRDFKLNHFKIKKHTDADKAYIGMQGGISQHLLNCIDLRKINHYGVEDVRRALTLTALSKKILTTEESNIYQDRLTENLSYYSRYTNSSVANANHLPLVFLTIQHSKDKRHYIIYEFRQNGAEINRYSEKISVSKPYINGVSQNYLNYLNNNSTINHKLTNYVPVDKKPEIVNVAPSSSKSIEEKLEQDYKVIKTFQGKKEPEKTEIKIPVGSFLNKLRTEKDKVYYIYENEECFSLKTWWDKGTKKVGGFE